jgi:hypothetical protein
VTPTASRSVAAPVPVVYLQELKIKRILKEKLTVSLHLKVEICF